MRAPLPAYPPKKSKGSTEFRCATPLHFCLARMGSPLSFLSFFLLGCMLSGTLNRTSLNTGLGIYTSRGRASVKVPDRAPSGLDLDCGRSWLILPDPVLR